MNLYLVVSEELRHDPEDRYEPPEYYRIAELVVARSHGQARWIAWCKRGDGPGDIRDMPKFAVRLKEKDVDGPARILNSEDNPKLWCNNLLWDVGHAPHIGYYRRLPCQTKSAQTMTAAS